MSPPLSTTAPLPTQGDAKTAPKGMKPGLWSQEPFYPFTGTLGPWNPLPLWEPDLEHPNLLTSSNRPAGPDPLSLPPSWTVTHAEEMMSIRGPIPASCHPEEPPQSLPHVSLGQIYKPSGTPGWSYGSNLPQTRRNILPTTLLRLVGAW